MTVRTEGTVENAVFTLSVTLALVAVVDSINGTDVVVTSVKEKSKNKCCTDVKRGETLIIMNHGVSAIYLMQVYMRKTSRARSVPDF